MSIVGFLDVCALLPCPREKQNSDVPPLAALGSPVGSGTIGTSTSSKHPQEFDVVHSTPRGLRGRDKFRSMKATSQTPNVPISW
jgi:hypothetical protein